MAKYRCIMCGYVYDESKESRPFSEIERCPACFSPKEDMKLVEEEEEPEPKRQDEIKEKETSKAKLKDDILSGSIPNLGYGDKMRYFHDIKRMADTGETIDSAMATELYVPSWDDILIKGAQLNPMPLDEHAEVNTKTIIGKNAKKPMVLDNPVYVTHMSFGALSKTAKITLAEGTAKAGSAMCSGEGGIIPGEMQAADKYIFEYVANQYSVTPDNLKNSDAIEIKIGQGTKPGMGGHLPADKVTEEIAKVRNHPMGHDIQAPSRFPGIDTKDDMKALVSKLREESEGRPIGIKISAGNIESDLEFCVYAEPDFITIDGRGGATGSSPKLLKDASSVPTIYALARARKYLDSVGSDISLIITGGLRVSSDFAKAIAMGADAIAIGTAALVALGCQQFRICGSGMCPVGIATQKLELEERLDSIKGAERVANFLNVSLQELKTYGRITGHDDIHKLSYDDICTINSEISDHTDIKHV